MDATTAMNQTNTLVTTMLESLTPDHREMATPCDDWTVHDLLGHMCGGVQGMAGGLQGQAPPEALAATHQMPFGEIPGEMAVSVIVADVVTHAWDLGQATGIDHGISDELAEFALQTWMPLVPADGRTGDGFKAVVEVGPNASALDNLVAYTGRQPSA
jgi:hypothetical protein